MSSLMMEAPARRPSRDVISTDGTSVLGRKRALSASDSNGKPETTPFWSRVSFNGAYVIDVLLIISLLSVETVLQNSFFGCPCDPDYNHKYAMCFFVIPALLLFISGIFCHPLTWRAVYGLYWRPGRMRHCRTLASYWVRMVTPRALLWPLVWLIYAFLNGDFYECMVSVDPSICLDDRTPLAKRESSQLKAHSQIIGLALLFTSLIVYILMKCVVRLWTPHSYLMFQYQALYDETLEKELHHKFTEYAKLEAETLWKEIKNKGLDQNNWTEPRFGLPVNMSAIQGKSPTSADDEVDASGDHRELDTKVLVNKHP